MDRISDSGSDGCGSIPHGGTKMTHGKTMSHFCTPYLFTPLIEPAEVFAVPHHGVLRLEDPVILVWEDQKT